MMSIKTFYFPCFFAVTMPFLLTDTICFFDVVYFPDDISYYIINLIFLYIVLYIQRKKNITIIMVKLTIKIKQGKNIK